MVGGGDDDAAAADDDDDKKKWLFRATLTVQKGLHNITVDSLCYG